MMKKLLPLLLALTVFLTSFSGCSAAEEETLPWDSFYRVEVVLEDGLVVDNGDRTIYVKWNQSSEYRQYDSVYLEYAESDLRSQTGTVIAYDDYELTYQYVLENPVIVRPSGPGEPTFA